MPSETADLVLALREARRRLGLTQKEVARLSGVGAKTISSFESGSRVSSLKVSQLIKLLTVYGLTARQFFAWSPEAELGGSQVRYSQSPSQAMRTALPRPEKRVALRVRELYAAFLEGHEVSRDEVAELFDHLIRFELTAEHFERHARLEENGWLRALTGARIQAGTR